MCTITTCVLHLKKAEVRAQCLKHLRGKDLAQGSKSDSRGFEFFIRSFSLIIMEIPLKQFTFISASNVVLETA